MSLLLRALIECESELRDAVNHATALSAHEARKRTEPKRPQEPDFVAMLVLEGVPVIAKALHHLLSPYGLHSAVSSVFCHQRPMVEFDSNKRCELGDVLLVHQHLDRNGRAQRNNALLLQAKMSRDLLSTVSGGDLIQLALYSRWPKFRYFQSGHALAGQVRSVRPKQRHSGAQYLLIDSAGLQSLGSGAFGLRGTHSTAVWHADSVLCAKVAFADEFLRFLQGGSGRLFRAFGKPDPSDWSAVVWDLLTYGVSHAFNRRRSGVNNIDRATGDLSLAQGQCLSFINGNEIEESASDSVPNAVRQHIERLARANREPPTGDDWRRRSDPGNFGGVSVILIETFETD